MNKLIKGNKKREKKETATTSKKCLIESDTIWLLPKIVLTRDIFSMRKILHCLVIDTLHNNHEPLTITHSFYKLINFRVWFLTVEPSDPYGLQERYQHKRYSTCLVIKHLKHIHSTLARREIDYQEILNFVTWYRSIQLVTVP